MDSPVSPSASSGAHRTGVDAVDAVLTASLGGTKAQQTRCLNRMVVTERNPFRRLWTSTMVIMLIYTATIFPAELAFWQCAIPVGHDISFGWYVVQIVSDIVFIIDLFVNFFLSFRDEHGLEVTELHRVVLHYLSTFFIINLLACIPPEALESVAPHTPHEQVHGESENELGMHKSLRILRLQRLSKLFRLVGIIRLSKLGSLGRYFNMCLRSDMMQFLLNFRTIRIANFVTGVFLLCHVLACFWYITAGIDVEEEESWVFGRFGDEVTKFQPFKHWLNSIYWVLTVCTSVGFGDMSAGTIPEMIYATCTMIIGCIANGIILTEVIGIITEVDSLAKQMAKQKDIATSFAEHVKVREDVKKDLLKWLSTARSVQCVYDRSMMKGLFLSQSLPRRLTSELPGAIFEGALMKNRFLLKSGLSILGSPTRFVCLVALSVTSQQFESGEVVYYAQEHVWNIFMVLNGVFASVAKPTETGGVSETYYSTAHLEVMDQKSTNIISAVNSEIRGASDPKDYVPYQLFCFGNYFGDIEIMRPFQGLRYTCQRCESPTGSLLVLGRSELNDLISLFPACAPAWKVIAKRRERRTRSMLAKLRKRTDYNNLAASIIQWHIRDRLKRRGIGLGNRGDKTWGIDILAEKSPTTTRSTLALGHSENSSFYQPDDKLEEDVLHMEKRIETVKGEMTQLNKKLETLTDLVLECGRCRYFSHCQQPLAFA